MVRFANQVTPEDLFFYTQQIYFHSAGYKKQIKGILVEFDEERIGIQLEDVPLAKYLKSPQKGQECNLFVYNETGYFTATVEYISQTQLPNKVFYFSVPKFFIRQQKRSFVRIPTNLPLQYQTRNKYNTFNNPVNTHTVDISGNGIRFVSTKKIQPTKTIRLEINDLPEIDSFLSLADVIRCIEIPIPTGKIYHIGVSFEKYLGFNEQTKLLHAINILQRNLLQKGIL